MTSQSYQSYFLLVVLCLNIILISESVTLDKSVMCLFGSDEVRGVCCIGRCFPNCSTECIKIGYQKGGQCVFRLGYRCCCFISS
ncbi:unnamed protein product [Lathyrus oleraceus]